MVILILSNGTINRQDIILNVFVHACVYTYNKFVLIEMELINRWDINGTNGMELIEIGIAGSKLLCILL